MFIGISIFEGAGTPGRWHLRFLQLFAFKAGTFVSNFPALCVKSQEMVRHSERAFLGAISVLLVGLAVGLRQREEERPCLNESLKGCFSPCLIVLVLPGLVLEFIGGYSSGTIHRPDKFRSRCPQSLAFGRAESLVEQSQLVIWQHRISLMIGLLY